MMRNYLKKTLTVIALTACLAMTATEAAAAAKINMGYLYFGTQTAFVQQVDATQKGVTQVSPTLFDLTSTGELKLASDITALVKAMKERGVKVMPFLSNHWDRASGREALAKREQLAAQIVQAVEQYNLDGVNVDLENMTEQDRDAYTDLVRLLREKLPAGKELSVAIAANPSAWTKGWQASYDVAKLAQYSDYLMLMAYDEHWNGDPEPGPVASLGWVEASVQQVLKDAPADKVLLGIPFYGRFWRAEGGITGAGIFNKTAEELADRYGITPSYDEEQQSVVFTFTVTAAGERPVVNGKALEPGTYTVWYENEESIKAKLELVQKYQLAGTGIWALSQETPDTWEYYGSWLNGTYYADTVGHWAAADIRSVARKGWMTGTASAVFAPESPLTRAEAAAILVRALDVQGAAEDAAPAAEAGGFKDVPASHWAQAEIAAARKSGLIDGYADGSFAPDKPVTREELAAVFSRALAKAGVAGTETGTVSASDGAPSAVAAAPVPFTDMSADRWSWTAVSDLQHLGLLQGYADGTFRPGALVTRAEAATLLLRAMQQTN